MWSVGGKAQISQLIFPQSPSTSLESPNLYCIKIEYTCLGLLPAVGSLTATPSPLDSIISLTWTPPFSLDVDSDITGYCVGVVNSTSSLVIHFQCGITDTHYNYTVSPRSTPCDTYTFTVTPVKVGNGISAMLSNITECEISHYPTPSYTKEATPSSTEEDLDDITAPQVIDKNNIISKT